MQLETDLGKIDALILCGGLGTRFRSVRDDIPKALAPIREKLFIDLILDDLIRQGFQRIILATGHLSKQLEKHVHFRNDAEYVISCEPRPLGTGGAIKYASTLIKTENVMIMNGDSHIQFDFSKLLDYHKQKLADFSLLLTSVTKGKDYGNVLLSEDGLVLRFDEKQEKPGSSLINAGVYCLKTSLLSSVMPNHVYSLEKDWMPEWSQQYRVFGYVTDQPVHDIGTPKRYEMFIRSSHYFNYNHH